MKHRALALAVLAFAGLTTSPALAQRLQVYILAGQSNMQGHAHVSTLDSLADDPETAPMLAEIREEDGTPRVREDVWISYLTSGQGGDGVGAGPLTVGYGARQDATRPGDKIGPELGFGITVGNATDAPVLLIKTAWGGKSLHTDFRPPSAGPYEFSDQQLERFAHQGEDIEKIRATKKAATGVFYRKMIEHVEKVLTDPGAVCPAYDPADGYEIAGFVWFQGWNDMVDRGTYPDRAKPGGYDRYTEVLTHFIRDVRNDLDTPDLPFVIGVLGVGGPIDPSSRYAPIHSGFREAMAAPAALPEFRNNVTAVATAPYWDARLQQIADKIAEVHAKARQLRNGHESTPNADGSMTPEEQREWIATQRAKIVGPENQKIYERATSNAAYHYLGAARILVPIGQAFAEAVLAMQE